VESGKRDLVSSQPKVEVLAAQARGSLGMVRPG
jgi:hypothetical protein